VTDPQSQDAAVRRTWLSSDRLFARFVRHRVIAFLQIEAAGGIVLLMATVAALVCVNSPAQASYTSFWHSAVALRAGGHGITLDLRHWVNEGLMTLFFFVVGMEIKTELVDGELRNHRAAVVPAVAAIGGMAFPALIYLVINGRGVGQAGWGIPMATDIAFTLGVVALLGSRVPQSLKVFLLTLAIVDDIGAIVVIAVFYSGALALAWLALAAALVGFMSLLQRIHVRSLPVYAVLGCAVWFATFESGVHATIAGVMLGLLTPARAHLRADAAGEAAVDTIEASGDISITDARRVSYLTRESVAVTERLMNALHPWTSFVIIPLFALANAGIPLSRHSLAGGWSIAGGVVAGLVLGKVVGITGAVWLAVRFGLGSMPEGATWRHVVGVAALAGIGFTVSLFVTDLAFADSGHQQQAKVGVLVASLLAAVLGSSLLVLAARRPTSDAGCLARRGAAGSQDS